MRRRDILGPSLSVPRQNVNCFFLKSSYPPLAWLVSHDPRVGEYFL
jgi:hypothetical protein